MKKIIALIAVMLVASMLAGCMCIHKWEDATCEDPKTCSKCGETEGEELGHKWTGGDCVTPEECKRCDETNPAPGHDWIPADCVTPKTCSVCSETEGDPLGHLCNEWEIYSDSEMSGSCTVCGELVTQEIDRELIGHQEMLGKWLLCAVQFDYGDWERCRDDSVWVEFFEDGSFVCYITEDDGGTIAWNNYNEEYDNYWFDATFYDEGTCRFRITPGENELYWVTSSMWLCFEKR